MPFPSYAGDFTSSQGYFLLLRSLNEFVKNISALEREMLPITWRSWRHICKGVDSWKRLLQTVCRASSIHRASAWSMGLDRGVLHWLAVCECGDDISAPLVNIGVSGDHRVARDPPPLQHMSQSKMLNGEYIVVGTGMRCGCGCCAVLAGAATTPAISKSWAERHLHNSLSSQDHFATINMTRH